MEVVFLQCENMVGRGKGGLPPYKEMEVVFLQCEKLVVGEKGGKEIEDVKIW